MTLLNVDNYFERIVAVQNYFRPVLLVRTVRQSQLIAAGTYFHGCAASIRQLYLLLVVHVGHDSQFNLRLVYQKSVLFALFLLAVYSLLELLEEVIVCER